jgi:hypothetical protein
MKRSCIFIFLLAGIINAVSAQDPGARQTYRYFNKTEVGAGIGLGKFKTDLMPNGFQRTIRNDQLIISPQTINGIIISDRVGLGVGIGAEFWQKGMFYPVFAHLFYDLKSSENTPYAFINLGEAFGKRDSTYNYASGKGGLLFSLGVGYKMKIGKRFQFEYELFYRYQAIQSTYRQYFGSSDTSHYSTLDYKVPYHFAGFKIGLLFH